MGNKALRRQLAAELKKAGMPKLYKGAKRPAYSVLPAAHMRQLLYLLEFKPGDIANDCDGFNHKVVRWVTSYYRVTPRKRWERTLARVIDFDQFEKEDGSWSCGCPSGPEKPRSREEVEKYHMFDEETIEAWKAGGWWKPAYQKRLEALQRGEHICDENGVLLPEYSANTMLG